MHLSSYLHCKIHMDRSRREYNSLNEDLVNLKQFFPVSVRYEKNSFKGDTSHLVICTKILDLAPGY